MQSGAVLFSHLLHRNDFVTKAREADKFLLNLLQTFVPLTVSDLGIGPVRAC